MNGGIDRTRAAWLLGLALVLLVLSGCSTPSATSSPEGPEASPSGTDAADAAVAVATATAGQVRLADLELGLTEKWSGFTSPLYLTNAGDGSGRIFVVEQGGLVKVIEGGAVREAPYLDLRSRTRASGEQGLLGMAFSPSFKSDGMVYVDYTDLAGNTVIERYTTPDPSSSAPRWLKPKRLLYIRQPYPNHNGGCLQFGPDGYLYIGMGDGGGAGDLGRRAQNRNVLLGKILRIDVSTASLLKPYGIPPTNPSKLTKKRSLRPAAEVWARGLRNPWRFSFDTQDGTLWIADVGQNAYEEIDYLTKSRAASLMPKGGPNYGWPAYEGFHTFPLGKVVAPENRSSAYVWPVFDYGHPTGQSVTGGYVYRGRDYPALVGTYLFADYLAGWIGGIRLRAPDGTPLPSREQRTLLDTSYLPSSFGVDERGELYLTDLQGTVYQVTGVAK